MSKSTYQDKENRLVSIVDTSNALLFLRDTAGKNVTFVFENKKKISSRVQKLK